MKKKILIFILFTLLFFAYKKSVFAATYNNIATGSISSSYHVTNPNNALGNSADGNTASTSADGTWSMTVGNFNVSGINPNEVVSAVHIHIYGTLDQATNVSWGDDFDDNHNSSCFGVQLSEGVALGSTPHFLWNNPGATFTNSCIDTFNRIPSVAEFANNYKIVITGCGSMYCQSGQTAPAYIDYISVDIVTSPPPLPVIFIPGIMGSEFSVNSTFNPNIADCSHLFNYSYNQGDTVWEKIDPSNVLSYKTCGKYLDVLKLQYDGQTSVYSQIGLKGTLITQYADTLSYLQQHGYTQGTNLFVFTYDWRKDIAGNMTALDSLINQAMTTAGTTKVEILAHSMGGLVARKYISDATRAQKVDTLVELGTPHAGAPDALTNLLYPTCIKYLDIICVVNGNEVNAIVQNFTGGFELLPSRLYYTLYPYLTPFNDWLDIDKNGVYGPLNYDQTHTMLSNLNKNMTAFNTADSFHNSLDSTYSTPNVQKTYLIAGTGFVTTGQIFEYPELSPVGTVKGHDFIPTDGDGIVPLLSATLNQISNVYYVQEKHLALAQTGPALDQARNLLYGLTRALSWENVQTTPYWGYSTGFSGGIYSVHSPTQIDAYDNQNNHTGKKSDGTYETNIPGSDYYELGDAKFIYLPAGGHYTLKTEATAAGDFDLKMKNYSNSTINKQTVFAGVSQTASTTASLNLDNTNPVLSVDVNGDGTNVQQVNPTYILTGTAASDYAAPVTRATLAPTQNPDGSYPNPTTVTLSATASAGFSVTTTYYKIDNGTQQTYASPFTVSGNGSHNITYWSVDSAGLTEIQNTKTFTIHTMVYDDALVSGWTDASFNAINATTTQPANVYSGSVAMASAIGANGGLDFQAPSGTTTNGSDTLHFALKASQAGQQYDVYVDSTYGQPLSTPVSLANYGGQPNTSGWTVYNIPLADLAATNVSLHDIVIHNPKTVDEPIVYVDQVELSSGSPTPLTTALSDDWSSGNINSAKWNNWGGSHSSVTSNQLQLTSTLSSGYYGVDSGVSGKVYDLTSSSVVNQLVNAGNQSLGSWEVYAIVLHPLNDTNNQIHFYVSNNTVYARTEVAGVNTNILTATYSSSVHNYFRIRESSGTLYFDTSADGFTWTNFTSTADPFDLTHLVVGQMAGTWNTEASTTTATFDNFNVLPLTSPASSLSDNWSSGSISGSNWNNWGGSHSSVVNQQLQETSNLSGGYYGVDSGVSGKVYDLTGSYVTNNLISAGNQSLGSWEVYPINIHPVNDTNNQAHFFISNNTLYARKDVAGVDTTLRSVAYSSSTYKFFRIREIGGTLYFDTSPDGLTWTNFTSTADPFDLTHLVIGQMVGTWNTEASTTSATFDNFNIISAPPTSSLSDDWSLGNISGAKWSNWGSPQTSMVSQQLQISSVLAGGYFGVDSGLSGISYDLTGSYVTNKLINAGNQTLGSWEVYAIVIHPVNDTNNQIHFFVSNNTVYARKDVAGVNTNIHTATYNSTTYKYFKVRESSGTLYFDTSSNGTSWTNFTSTADPFDLTHLVIGQMVGTWNAEATTTSATFDNFNIAP